MSKIYLVRHCQSKWNFTSKIQGQIDIDLSKNGYKQAIKVGQRLKNEKIDLIYTSDLIRAFKTALIISFKTETHKIKKTHLLREIDFGPWQGLTINEVKKIYSDDYSLWLTSPHEFNFNGIETLNNLKDRIIMFIDSELQKNLNKNILIVSHSSVIKIIILTILGFNLSYYKNFSLDNGGITIIENKEYNSVIKLLNDTSHLREV
ncbi:histidine phosphatase family protein [Caldisalinibacter kiritimatiensis]|uniref:Phosphoglycerate mutase n=1 Tax=Caldisalinibacter kiritimatiensis TaxID=1304284 RepID=R1CWU6_9FIRM|nr:histidine phosphatase family protein [Caldisalinibacter kiritimatiensis]EOD01099.1 Phosphoglycerate mutase [Caldisalinibacter kiritimatiensis]